MVDFNSDTNHSTTIHIIHIYTSYVYKSYIFIQGYLFIINSLTCTVDSISLKTSNAVTLKATKGVIAGGIFMTVDQLSCTLINV